MKKRRGKRGTVKDVQLEKWFDETSSESQGDSEAVLDYLEQAAEEEGEEGDIEREDKEAKEKDIGLSTMFHAQQELRSLHKDLQEKAAGLVAKEKKLRERELSLEAREGALLASQSAVEERLRLVQQEEARMGRRAKEDERMLAQDARAMRELLRGRAREEMDQQRENFEFEKANMQVKMETLQSQLDHKKHEIKQLERKLHLVSQRKQDAERDLRQAHATLSGQEERMERVLYENENLRKKLKLERWKLEKLASKKDQLEREKKQTASHLSMSQQSNGSVSASGVKGSVGEYLLLLIDGLTQLVLERSGKRKGPQPQLDWELFTQKIFPGISHALELNAVCGSTETCKRLLTLILFCLEGTQVFLEDAKQGLLTRIATRLLKTLQQTEREAEEVEDTSLAALAATASLCVYMMKKPLEPGRLLVSLQALRRHVNQEECQTLLVLHPVSLEPILHVLRFTRLAAWHLCVTEASLILLALTRRRKQLVVSTVSQSPHFCQVACTVLDAAATVGSTSDQQPICEAASVIAIYLERLCSAGLSHVNNLFRQVDLRGMLSEAIRAMQDVQQGAKESADFFVLNANVVLAALPTTKHHQDSNS